MESEVDQGKFGEPTEEMKKSTQQKKLDWIEDEIKDIQACLRGSASSRHYRALDIQLKNLQNDRKHQLWHMYGVAKYPHSEGDNVTAPPRNLNEQIPDL